MSDEMQLVQAILHREDYLVLEERIRSAMARYGLTDQQFLSECVQVVCALLGTSLVKKQGALHESVLIATANHHALRARLGGLLDSTESANNELLSTLTELRKRTSNGQVQ